MLGEEQKKKQYVYGIPEPMTRFIEKVCVSKIVDGRVFFSIYTHLGVIETSAKLTPCIRHNPVRESVAVRVTGDFCRATQLALEESDLNWIRKRVNENL